MNSALKPVGASTTPVPQQLNKPLHQQNTPTYGQPLSHIPQNLVNLPLSASSPANAHSNNIHATNRFPITTSNVSQSFSASGGGGAPPPPSNHPVASLNPSAPIKNISYSPNTNNLAHSYKLPLPAATDSMVDPLQVVTEELPTEKPQSNGTPEEIPSVEQESPESLQAETSTANDKPPPSPKTAVPDATTINTEKPNETRNPIITPEKPVEMNTPTLPAEESTLNSDTIEASTPEAITSSKPADLPEATAVAPIGGTSTTPVVTEPIVTSSPSIESSSSSSVTTLSTTNSDVPIQIDKIEEKASPPPKLQTTDLISDKEATSPSTSSSVTSSSPLDETTSKPTIKLQTTQRIPVRKTKLPLAETVQQVKVAKIEVKIQSQKSPSLVAKSQRNRTRTQPYQSPLPEVEMISKISAIASTSKTKTPNDKLTVFYKNEFLAVRNPDGGFYLCQALHNIFKSTRKLRILWLTQDKSDGDIFTPDFYDQTDFDCILTNINLTRVGKGKFKLPDKERIRTDSILKRALAVEKGDATPICPTEEHPDGLDLSLYKEEGQLKKRKTKKRKASPFKTSKTTAINKSPDQVKVRKVEPRHPPVTKALVIKKALAVKAKESSINANKQPVKAKLVETVTVTKTVPVVEQKKIAVPLKVVKKPAVATPAVQSPTSSSKPLPSRKQSVKTTDTVVPFLRKELPVLKKEVPAKKEYLVLKKESVLKKEISLKKDTPPKRNLEVSRKDVSTVRKEMPVLKKEMPTVKKDVTPQKQILTRKSSRGKK